MSSDKPWSGNQLMNLNVIIEKESTRDIRVSIDGKTAWLPKSKIKITSEVKEAGKGYIQVQRKVLSRVHLLDHAERIK